MAEAQLSVDDLDIVLRRVFGARSKWYNVGLGLGMTADVLDRIRAQYGPDPDECFREMLKCWLQSCDPSPTWSTMVKALNSPTVGQTQLARQVEEEYCPIEDSVSPASSQGMHSSNESLPDESQKPASSDKEPQPYGCGCDKCTFDDFLENGCPSPILKMSSFPYLNTKGLSRSQQQILKGRLYMEFQDIMCKFSQLKIASRKSLTAQEVTVKELSEVLMDLGAFHPALPQKPLLEDQMEDIKKCTDILDVFFIIREYDSFFNYKIVEHIINQLGTTEDHERLKKYKEELDEYSKRSVFECPTFSVPRPNHADLVVKIDDTFEKYNIKHLEAFLARLSKIVHVAEYSLRLCSVDKGCLQLRLQAPTFVVEAMLHLTDDQKQRLIAFGVTKMELQPSGQVKVEVPLFKLPTQTQSPVTGKITGSLLPTSSPVQSFSEVFSVLDIKTTSSTDPSTSERHSSDTTVTASTGVETTPSQSQANVSPANYKKILNEYCQKNQFTVPQYTCEYPEDSVGYIACLSITGKEFRSPPKPSKKAAELLAAAEAVKSLGIPVSGGQSSVQARTKPPQATDQSGLSSYKNLLQEYVQKEKLSLPSYSTLRTGEGFQSTVTLVRPSRDNLMVSSGSQPTKKAAEQEAARIACDTIGL